MVKQSSKPLRTKVAAEKKTVRKAVLLSARKKLTVMVSSTVYGFEENLEQICATLEGFGYEVWCSYKGRIPTDPAKSNAENCIIAVANCDLFLGIIRTTYGSGIVGDKSITHMEMAHAVDLKKPRWFLAHRDIDLVRQLLKKLSVVNKDGTKSSNFVLEKGPVMDDLRVIEMYNYAIMSHLPIENRTGQWVQPYFNFSTEGMAYIKFQFEDTENISRIVQEMKANP